MNDYTVYMHVFPNNKKYIGITRQEPKKRYRGGSYYYTQVVGKAIKKYGWANIEHKIIYTNLTKEEAEKYEQELIKKHKTIQKEYGYNISIGGNVGQRNNYMSKEARNFVDKIRSIGYDDAKKIIKWWQFLCEDELEAKVFNNAYKYVDEVMKNSFISSSGDWAISNVKKMGAINVYLEAWQNDWTPECAKYNSKYYLENSENIIWNSIFDNDNWKMKEKIS